MAGAEPVRRTSGSQAVYARLREGIVSGAIEPGARLHEPELAERLGVSRTPVREALRQLLAEDLVRALSTGGMRVAELDVDEVREVYAVRAALEGLVAREAAQRVTEEQAAELRELIAHMEAMRDFEQELLRLGKEFHQALERIAGNRQAIHLMRQLRGHVDRYRELTTHLSRRKARIVDEHTALMDAVLSGDPDRAEAAARQHISGGAEAGVEAVRQRLGDGA